MKYGHSLPSFKSLAVKASAYVYTLGLAIGATLVLLVVIGTLARVLPEEDFYQFTVLNRYVAFIAIACNIGLAFSFIRYSRDVDLKDALRIAGVGRLIIDIATGAVFFLWLVYSFLRSETGVEFVLLVLTFSWVYSQSFFHLTAPLARYTGGMRSYSRIFLYARLIPPVIGLSLAVLFSRFELYFFGYAMFSVIAQSYLWKNVYRVVDFDTAKNLIIFSSSRWFESMLRAFLPVLFIFGTEILIDSKLAGAVAIIYTLSKAIESLLQPLVIAAMMRQNAITNLGTGMGKCIVLAIFITTLVFFSYNPVIFLIGLLLGENYTSIGEESWIVLLGAGPIIAMHLLRALNDNRFRVSPMLFVNLTSVAYILVACIIAHNLRQIAISICLLQFSRFILYAIFTQLFIFGNFNLTSDEVNKV